jgi:flagellar biosynthesis protein FlhF
MHLKRYQRQTVQDALRAVREDLGPEALVLSTRLVAAPAPRGWFGGKFVEITAAANRPTVTDDRHVAADGASGNRLQTDRSREAETVPERRSRDAIAARLEATGLDAGLARQVAAAHPADRRRGVSTRTLSATLAKQLAPLVAHDDRYAPIEVFIGPPGVGKTTTIAKIAAQERARRGNRLGLVAADGYRVGAVEQLRSSAHLLGSPLSVARTPYELQTALEAAAVPVLVDTAGRSHTDDGAEDMLRVVASRPDARTHLVLAADTPLPTMQKIVDRFARAQPSRVVLTKVDETDSLAPLVSFLRERKLMVSYLGVGQRVPDDLHVATPQVFAGWVAGDRAAGGAVA